MSTSDISTVVSGDHRRNTIVNLKHVYELPLRNALVAFDKNGDGKIDIRELQRILYWYGLWKYASIGLCMVILVLVWSTFGLTIWAINLTKDFTVTNGVLAGNEEVVKMSVADSLIPLSWATLLDRRHLDALESITIAIKQDSGKFTSGVYHMKVASYLHVNSTYLKVYGQDGGRVWVNSGNVVVYHPDADEAILACGDSACNTLAVDVKPDYLQQLIARSQELYKAHMENDLQAEVDGIAVNKADGKDGKCMAWVNPNDNNNRLKNWPPAGLEVDTRGTQSNQAVLDVVSTMAHFNLNDNNNRLKNWPPASIEDNGRGTQTNQAVLEIVSTMANFNLNDNNNHLEDWPQAGIEVNSQGTQSHQAIEDAIGTSI